MPIIVSELTRYRTLLQMPETFRQEGLPPVPTPEAQEEDRALAWSDWWDAVEKQREFYKGTMPAMLPFLEGTKQ